MIPEFRFEATVTEELSFPLRVTVHLTFETDRHPPLADLADRWQETASAFAILSDPRITVDEATDDITFSAIMDIPDPLAVPADTQPGATVTD